MSVESQSDPPQGDAANAMPPEWTPSLQRTWTLMVEDSPSSSDAGASLRPRTEVITADLPPEEASSFGPKTSEARDTAAQRPAAWHRQILVARGGNEEDAEREPPGFNDDAPPELALRKRIGVGAMGEVFEARQRSLARTVAIKLMREGDGADPRSMRQFESEAIIAGRLDHPNIVPIHDLGVDEQGRLVYFMKRVEGTPWSKLLRADAQISMTGRAVGSRSGKGTHSMRDHIEILLAVCDAVAFAHSRGFVHRDIKPENVIVGAYGEVQLIDWGLAASIRPAAEGDENVSNLADAVVTCGTPAYMPPETSLGLRARVSPASDVYTLAAILFEVLYGRRLHTGKTVMDVVRAAGRNAWHFPDVIREAARPFHTALRPLIDRCLNTDPRRRPPDGAAFAIALREHLDRIDSTALANSAHRALIDLRSEQHDPSDTLIAARPTTPEARYRGSARVIARLEEAIAQWPGNPDARAWLADAHLYQARQAIEAGDLLAAAATLDDVRELPGTAHLPPDVSARLEGMREQVAERIRIRARRQRVNRVLRVVAIGLLAVSLGMVAVADIVTTQSRNQAMDERDAMSRSFLMQNGKRLQRAIESRIAPAESAARVTAEWARRGDLDPDEPEALDRLLMPLLRGLPLVTSMIRADMEGNEYMILSERDGWRTRQTRVGQKPVWRHYARDGRFLREEVDDTPYDPRTRPWFRTATAMSKTYDEPNAADLVWTDPYPFHTTRDLGMSVVTVAQSPAGKRFVIVYDVTFADVSRYTVDALPADRGTVFLADGEGHVLGLPNDPRFADPAARREAVFDEVDELDVPLAEAAWDGWTQRGRHADDIFDLEIDDRRYFVGVFTVKLAGAKPLWTFVAVPVSGFAGPS